MNLPQLQQHALVFHEHEGFKASWPLELELLRAILEKELPEGESIRDILDGKLMYWRWRDWIICVGNLMTYENKKIKDILALTQNMLSFNLPEHFTELLKPISEVIGETLMHR